MDQNEEGAVPEEDELNAAGGEDAAGDEGDEGLPEGEEGAGQGEGDDEGGEQHAESRAQTRHQRLANERKQEREARIQAEAEAKLHREQAEFYRRQAEQLAQQQRSAPPADEPYMDPDEKWRRETQAAMQRGLAQTQDLADKANFALAAVKNPLQAKYVDKVEAEVQKLRAQGNYSATREGVFLYLLGQDTAANYGKKTPAAAAAEKRVAAAKTKPAPSGSNVQAPRGGKSAEDRLQGVIL